jgi:PAS domain S-box-containing protein
LYGTARKREAALDPAPELSTFFEVSLDLLCIRDSQFRFVKVNQAWEATLGYDVGELEGAPMLDFIHPDDAPASHGHMMRLEVEEEVKGFINRYRRRDGSYVSLEWRARRVGDLVFGVARDVTDRLAAEAATASAKLAAEAANRAKSAFLANMSHEIRTPLNGVIGITAALARTGLTAEQREMVELIESSGVTLERLVSDILDLSKIEAGRLELEERVFDLRGELDGVIDVFRLRAEEKGLAFPVFHGPDARGDFLGDSTRLRQVLANLLSNAVKFTEAGEVAVRIEVRDAGRSRPATLAIEVRDSGVGFDADYAGRLFERFSQADGGITRRFGGTGLGLSISRALVEMMGGTIEARSRPGRGSCVRISLPMPRARSLEDHDAERRQAELAQRAEEAQTGERLASLRLLLAEDHPVNQRVVQLILAPLGAQLTIVGNGAAAIEAVGKDDFDLILMDMQMPVMDGLAATRAIRERERAQGLARTPVIMLSANAMRQHLTEARAAGADRHLAKPFTPSALIGVLIEALDANQAPAS